jgi:hypothetical protein
MNPAPNPMPNASSNTQMNTKHIPIPTFCGNGSERDLNGFIRACERFLVTIPGDEVTKVNLVLSRLSGEAANTIYRGNHDFSWASIKALLLQRYGRWAVKIEDIITEVQNAQPSTDRIVPFLHDLDEIISEGEAHVKGAQIILEPLARQNILKYLPPAYEDICKMDTYIDVCNKARRLDREGYRIGKKQKHTTINKPINAPVQWQLPIQNQNFNYKPQMQQFQPRGQMPQFPPRGQAPPKHSYPPSPFSLRQKQNFVPSMCLT